MFKFLVDLGSQSDMMLLLWKSARDYGKISKRSKIYECKSSFFLHSFAHYMVAHHGERYGNSTLQCSWPQQAEKVMN